MMTDSALTLDLTLVLNHVHSLFLLLPAIVGCIQTLVALLPTDWQESPTK